MFDEYVRSVTKEDRIKLPRLSYSGMEQFKNCPYAYDLKYNKKLYANDKTLALELGSLLHYVLEQRIKYIINDKPIDYDILIDILNNGVIETDEKTKEHILGLGELKRKYFEEWYEPDNKSGMDYNQKMKVFQKALYHEMEDTSEWRPAYVELPFEFVYKDRVIFNGFIDRIDLNSNGEFRVIDYKSSKTGYDNIKLSTSLQFGVYALAICQMFGKLPIEFLYRFVLIDETQKAMTKGWERRLEKALDKILDGIEKDKKTGYPVPKPCPLCAWCSFSITNPKAKQYKDKCEYYSLWTPNNPCWGVNKKYNALDVVRNKCNNEVKKRKLNF